MLLIPLFQIAGVAATLRLLRRWRRGPAQQPRRGRMCGRHILLPLLAKLALAAVPVVLWFRGMLQSMRVFMPDFSWIALICGGFVGLWACLRTGLLLRTIRAPAQADTEAG